MKRLIQQSVGLNESGHTDMPNRYAQPHAVVHDQLLDHNDSLVGLTQACHQCLNGGFVTLRCHVTDCAAHGSHVK